MKNVKSFPEFINEDEGSAKLAAAGRSMLGDLLSGKQFATGGFETKPSNEPVTIGSTSSTSDQSLTATTAEPLTSVPAMMTLCCICSINRVKQELRV